MNKDKTFAKPPTAQEAVLEEVRTSLLDGTLAPGTRINVDGMATEMNVSRAPVRDALRILEGEGQVEYKPHRGYTVPELDPEDLFQIYRLRELIETEAILMGFERIDELVLGQMRSAAADVTEAVKARDKVSGTFANRRFHFALFETCGQERLVKTIRNLWNADVYRTIYFADPAMTEESDREHYDIIDAAGSGDIDRLIEVSNHHRNHALQMVLTVLEQRGELPGGIMPDESAWRALLPNRG